MSKKIKSYVIEINGIRYKRARLIMPFSNICSMCDLDELCGSDEMGAPCSGGGDYFKKE